MPGINLRQKFSSFRNALSDTTSSFRPRRSLQGSLFDKSGARQEDEDAPERASSPLSRPKPTTASPKPTIQRRSTTNSLWERNRSSAESGAVEEGARRASDLSKVTLPPASGPHTSLKLHRIEKSDLKVKSKVGEGSFGLVLSATWIPQDRTVVIKVLKPREYFEERLAESDVTYHDIVAAFRREIRLMSDCGEHPNLVPILGKGGNDTMLVMSAASMDLHKLSKKVGKDLSLQLVQKWGRDILSAISHIHNSGIIHQDVKTSNILIFDDGEAKICDFGLAVRMTDDLRVNRELCTLWYRPPELLMGCRTYTPLVDEWGVGCIILEMLIGTVPLPGDTSRTCTCKRQSHINYNKDQLQRIFRLVGSPGESEASSLACFDHFRGWPAQHSTLEVVVQSACHHRVAGGVDDLSPEELSEVVADWSFSLSRLMALSPDNRIPADDALALPVFRDRTRLSHITSLPPCRSPPSFSGAAGSPSVSPLRIPSNSASPIRSPDRSPSGRTASNASVASTSSASSMRSARGSMDGSALEQAQRAASTMLWPNLSQPLARLARSPSKRSPAFQERSSSDLHPHLINPSSTPP